jgi:hypothetical protein
MHSAARRCCLALFLTSAFVLASSPVSAQQSLAGYQYVLLPPPVYENNQLDVYGLGARLSEKFRKDPSWIVINSPDELGSDKSKIGRTVICAIEHRSGLKGSVTFRKPDRRMDARAPDRRL